MQESSPLNLAHNKEMLLTNPIFRNAIKAEHYRLPNIGLG
jgi:hypothetical protein